ncbi:MAG: glycosyltransferase family 39 protein, partial [Solirubrobacteraceae bacterium]
MRSIVAVLALATLLWRTGAMDAGYWIDEAIAVGIASYDLVEIPRVLRQDGSPPLYYLLLHGWMALAGTGEAATRALSLVFALVAVPVAWWAGRAAFDTR